LPPAGSGAVVEVVWPRRLLDLGPYDAVMGENQRLTA
jgi:two-component system sensor histidine kinase RegB